MRSKIDVIDEGARPFLRWAGGKSWLIRQFSEPLSDLTFRDYHEPFLGGASFFLFVRPHGNAYLSDLNQELIETYETVKNNIERVISELEKFKNSEKFYYAIRDMKTSSKIKSAARFIYLNQTSFNGIYRVNLEGEYNVPYGHRSKEFLEPNNLRMVSMALKNANLSTGDFNDSIKYIKRSDLVFLDPPYTVSHNNNGFIKYNQKLFSIDDQYRLADFIKSIKRIGAYYILTNAAHKKINEIFGQIDEKIILKRASLIGGKEAIRGSVSEYLFTNIPQLK